MFRKLIFITAVMLCLIIAACLCACGFANIEIVTPATTTEKPVIKPTDPVTSTSIITDIIPETVTDTEKTDDPVTSIETETVTIFTTVVTTPEVTTSTTAETTKAVTTATTTAKQTTKLTTKKVTDAPKTVTTNEAGYAVDLSAYEKYMNPTGEDWGDEYLVLVNASRPQPADFESSPEYEKLNKRVKVGTVSTFTYYPTIKMNEVALKAFTALTLEAHEYGIDCLDFTSGYRPYSNQETIFNNNIAKTRKYVCDSCGYIRITKYSYSKCSQCGGKVVKVDITRDEAAAEVATYSCAPGTSEHQTGLAADIIQTSLPSAYRSLIQDFGKTEAGIWLEENCYRFGFILRFPKDKEDITGIIYEPWHFRFVGKEHATKMHELNMCLEEYVEYLEQSGYFDNN